MIIMENSMIVANVSRELKDDKNCITLSQST
jgi:hypothetical protein